MDAAATLTQQPTDPAATGARAVGRLPASVATLLERVGGQVVLSGDPGWDEARRAWNLTADQRPAAVVLVDSVDDVVTVVDVARATGLRVAAQGTGHGASPLASLEETILLRTGRLRGVEIDAPRRRARVEAGAVWADVVGPAAERGFVVLHGSSPDVGVLGYTLGGGIGWLARSHGLAANTVTAVEIVTADGRLVRADQQTEADLFWAVRGGGGSFGVVTAIEFELFETPELCAGALFWPVERAAEVLAAWRSWVDTVPEEVMSVGRVLHLPPLPHLPEHLRGGSFAVVEAVFTGPERQGEALVAPLRALAPAMDTIGVVGPHALQTLHMDPPQPVPAAADGILLEGVPPEAIEAFARAAVPPLLTIELRHLGGALAAPSPGHGAVGAIEADFAMFAAGIATTPEAHRAVAGAIDRAKAALAPWESPRAYLNFSERPVEASRLYPAETYERLSRLRGRWDPTGMFVANHPIPSPS